MFLNPGKYIVTVFKGVRPAARALGIDPANISRWQNGQMISTKSQIKILKIAKAKRLPITARDLLFGRQVRK